MMTRLHLQSLISKLRIPALAAAGAVLCVGSTNDAVRLDSAATNLPDLTKFTKKHWNKDACKRTAFVLRHASYADARSDFYVGLANCYNNPNESFWRCVRELNEEYRDAYKLAREQYSARLKVCKLLGKGPYDPEIDPEDFSPKVDNKYFPIIKGRTMVYEKKFGGETETITITVLEDTIEIEDIECVQVRDTVKVDGEDEEDTIDWYAQHKNGDVWYIGEIAKNFEDGMLDNLDGSWRYGKDGAKPGIIMLKDLKIGKGYRQEFLPNEAEDVAIVVSLGNTVTVPAGTFKDCLKTDDFTPLEPDHREFKYYAPGVGLVLEVDPDTGARTELVKIITE